MKCVEVLEKDFKEALKQIDFGKPYNPYSREFMKPLFIGQLMLAAKSIEDDVQEELDGATKYWKMFQETGDVQYREMAHDELKHAGILIKKHLAKTTDEAKKAHLNELEKERTDMLKLVKVEV